MMALLTQLLGDVSIEKILNFLTSEKSTPPGINVT